jgi:hypothetical protein
MGNTPLPDQMLGERQSSGNWQKYQSAKIAFGINPLLCTTRYS